MNEYFYFVFLFILGLISPGPDFLIVFKNSLHYHSTKKYYTVLGISIGNIVHGVGILFFLTLLNIYFAFVLNYLKLFGSAYLLYLGLKMMFSKSELQHEKMTTMRSSWNFFLEGLFVNLLNPKVVVFFVSLFSFYIKKASFDLQAKIIYVGTMFLLCFTWFFLVTHFFSRKRIKDLLTIYNTFLSKAMGFLFIFFSINLFLYQ